MPDLEGNVKYEMQDKYKYCPYFDIQGGARNVIPLIVHITPFHYYKSI